ncbi:SDR family oxidoreductase [uncultured Ruminococcus sp.]|uniref:SDR family oxidoreductase n=1 Tax=uncultured Ruminococcus sp. TaxID=165186 RepID=UPI002930C480|nr:SDR family oxidoreductase [uncultured Ruminococcus sp.]
MTEHRIAVVTGGSSGIGRSTAQALSAKGCTVYELSRRDNPPEGVSHLTADITDEQQVKKAIGEVISREGKIDILVNNAGYGISGAAEMTDSADSHAQLELNLHGMDNVTRAVLPYMRERKSGRIVSVSSIAGILPIPFQLWYSVSKAAINAYVLALQNEVRPYGISVCAVMPGDIATGFTDARKKSDSGNEIYSGRIERSVATMEKDERGGMSPDKAGRYIAKLAMKKRTRPMKAIGISYKAISILTKLLPRRLSNYLVGMIYSK